MIIEGYDGSAVFRMQVLGDSNVPRLCQWTRTNETGHESPEDRFSVMIGSVMKVASHFGTRVATMECPGELIAVLLINALPIGCDI